MPVRQRGAFPKGFGLTSWAQVQPLRVGWGSPRQHPSPTRSTGGGDFQGRGGGDAGPQRTVIPCLPGYSLVTHIPAGARDIQIVERKKSADVLGTRVGPGAAPVRLWLCLGQNAWLGT